MKYSLKTIGHATMVLFEDDKPLVATDPWLIGSAYWRSWWLEKYPTEKEYEQVKQAEYLYFTHSHPDHFHYPTIRALGKKRTLHPRFPRYEVTEFMNENGYPVQILEPWQWYNLTENARIASVPVPIDDSVLILDTPNATVINLNDSVPRMNFLRLMRDKMLIADKPLIVLKSYSPASIASSIYRDGKLSPIKSKQDYANVAQEMAKTLGAKFFVPFASQVFFSRTDSKWANEYKVKYEDLQGFWRESDITLCPPFVEMNLDTLKFSSSYADINRNLEENKTRKVVEREAEEEAFVLPADFDAKLKKYLDEVYFLRLFFRRGIGWRLTTGDEERFYNTRTKKIEYKIPENYDVIISLPDKVLYECLENNILTDLGITMFIKVDSKISDKFTYGLFLLMGLHDYGHFNSFSNYVKFCWFYAPYMLPVLWRMRWSLGSSPDRHTATPLKT